MVVLGSSMANAQTPAPAAPPPPPENVVPAAATLAAAPQAKISNGVVSAVVLLPTGANPFYRGTRFDHGGIVASLTYKGLEYYGLWFDATATNVRDYVFHEGKIVTSLNTGIMGPAEAFDVNEPPGWAEAGPDGRFLKIGVGMLRKPADGANYSSFRLYEVADPGRWTATPSRDAVAFTHTLSDTATGYGYIYRKTIRLVPGKPQMRIEHSLTNTGSKALATTMFNHNFLTLGGAPAREGFTVRVPYAIKSARPPKADAARIEGDKVVYLRSLVDGEAVSTALDGFGPTAADNLITVTSPSGAGYSVQGDQPLASAALWSIRSNVSAEPFVTLKAEPGQTVSWSSTYTYVAAAGGR